MNDWISVRARQLFDGLAARLKDVQEPALVIAALVASAYQMGGQLPEEGTNEEKQRWLLERLEVLLGAADKQLHQMESAFNSVTALLNEYDNQGAADETATTDDIRRTVEDAAMRFWGMNVVPLILLFSEQEQKDIGETPFAHLVALLLAAEAGDGAALEQALALVRKLAGGAQMQAWHEPWEYRIARQLCGVPEQEPGAQSNASVVSPAKER